MSAKKSAKPARVWSDPRSVWGYNDDPHRVEPESAALWLPAVFFLVFLVLLIITIVKGC